jgi:hypothetical protein
MPTGPKAPASSVLSIEDEAVIAAFRRHTLLPLDDCLYSLQPTIPHLTRSSLHRCLQRHGISRLPEVQGDRADKKKFKTYPMGYFHIDIAEVQTAEGKLYLYVAIDRTSKFAFVQLVKKTGRTSASAFLVALIAALGAFSLLLLGAFFRLALRAAASDPGSATKLRRAREAWRRAIGRGHWPAAAPSRDRATGPLAHPR